MNKFFFILLISCPVIIIGQANDLSLNFFKSKRDEFRKEIPEASVAVLFSAPIRNRANDINYVYHQDPNFYYLTGWKEPHAVLLIYKEAQKDKKGIFYNKIFIRSPDPIDEMWNGKYTTCLLYTSPSPRD